MGATGGLGCLETMSHRACLTLEEALDGVLSCHACSLGDTRTNVVPGDGPQHAGLMLIGEAPGKNEDEQGRPFVGAAGEMLDSLLEGIGMAREDVYIANILKCRPPKNRNPRTDEIAACTPWLRAQIEAVRPSVLVTMGNFATRFILQSDEGITSLRGTVHEIGAFCVLPTFHPAAVIYDRSKQGALEEDFARARRLLDGRE